MEKKRTREELEKRRDEIKAQLNEVNEDERIELDYDMEEQAIQMQQHEVAVTMEKNLHDELVEIENKLLEMKEGGE